MFRLKPRHLVLWLSLAVMPLLNSCGKRLNRSDCEALLLHYTELIARSDRPDATSLERLKFKELAREKAGKDPEMARCGQTVTRTQFECAMAAPTTDEFERCLM